MLRKPLSTPSAPVPAPSERILPEEGIRVVVREGKLERDGRFRYFAELTIEGQGLERAVVEADGKDALAALLPQAVRAFAACARLRRR